MDGPRLVIDAARLASPSDAVPTVDRAAVELAVEALLRGFGSDPTGLDLRETPRRVAGSWSELLSGVGVDPVAVVEPLVSETGSGVIMVRDIPVVSTCEHHLLPFVGSAAVAYLPNADGTIAGLSKLPRLVDVLSRRLQVQERLVREIADALQAALAPRGVFVLVEAVHLCMRARGARVQGATVITTEVRGVYADDAAARAELLQLARASS